MTKFFLSLFGNYEWNDLPSIPLFAFEEGWIKKFFDIEQEVSQWVYPHLVPMAYLRHFGLKRDVGPGFDLKELVVDPKHINKALFSEKRECNHTLHNIVQRMMEINQPAGSFGAYTVSSLFSIIVLQDYKERCPETPFADKIPGAVSGALSFIEKMYFDSGSGSYMGVLDDGHLWDSALLGGALAESGVINSMTRGVAQSLVDAQQDNGGIPFGIDFEYAPDVDDTAETVIFWKRMSAAFDTPRDRATQWLRAMQNKDGGWGAFNRDRGGNWLVAKLAAGFANSAEIFDPSSVDVTAHILEALGMCGTRISSGDDVVNKAVQYIRDHQDADGKWLARWGVNYLYGTGAALVGLARVGIDPMQDKAMQNGLSWLMSKQNADGGFGETTESYVNSSLAGIGVSTPSQTAWALLGLLEGFRVNPSKFGSSVESAVAYLVSQHGGDARGWHDQSSVGTGHPKILYMQYPSYAQSFPLCALARYTAMQR